jgi:protein associated with RNAse G/E
MRIALAVWVSDHRYEMIDLDLDVAVYRDGTVEVQDEDEFRIHQVQYRYTADMISRAKEETSRIVTALETRQEPFFEVAAAWLARLPARRSPA